MNVFMFQLPDFRTNPTFIIRFVYFFMFQISDVRKSLMFKNRFVDLFTLQTHLQHTCIFRRTLMFKHRFKISLMLESYSHISIRGFLDVSNFRYSEESDSKISSCFKLTTFRQFGYPKSDSWVSS